MNILIVNDDGINSPAIIKLAQLSRKLGKVTVCAPSDQCSAMSHRISVFGTLDVVKENFPVENVEAYSVNGSPADCVKIAINAIMDEKPDVIFSGINNGFNIGRDIMYSGTVGAATEGLNNGIVSFALSYAGDEDFSVVEEYFEKTVTMLLEKEIEPYALWNINFPSGANGCIKGIKENCFPSKQQYYHNVYTPTEKDCLKTTYTLSSVMCTQAEKGSDMDAIFNNYISIGKVYSYILEKSFN